MPTIPTGVQVDLAYKVESTNGVAAGASGATYLRRVTCDLDLDKDSYESDEIIKTYQTQDFRHGMRKVGGTLNGRLAPGAYAPLVAAGLRRAWSTGVATTGTTIAAGTGVLTDSASGFLTAGFKVGDVVTPGGFTGAGTGNNGRYYFVTDVVAGTMSVINLNGQAATLTADAAGEAVTVTVVGKKTYVPSTAHTNLAFTIEKLYGTTTPISEVYLGCKVGTMAISLPSTGLAGINFGLMGYNRQALGTSAYFTSVGAANTNGLAAAVNGAVLFNGSVIGVITNMTINIDGGMSTGSVVGSNITPDVFVGRVKVTGQIEVYLTDSTFIDAFDNETEVSIAGVFTLDSSSAPKFHTFIMPRCKLGSAKKSDGEGPVIVTSTFTALYNSTGGTGTETEQSTIVVQDSDAP